MSNIYTEILILTTISLIPAVLWFVVFYKKHYINVFGAFLAFCAGGFSTLPILFYDKLVGIESNLIFFKIIPVVDYQSNIVEFFGFNSFQEAVAAVGTGYFHVALLSIFFTFILGVGISEELIKHIVVNPRLRFVLKLIVFTILVYYLVDYSKYYVPIGILSVYLLFLYLMPKFIKFKSVNDIVVISIFAAIGFSFVENILYFHTKYLNIASEWGPDFIFEYNSPAFKEFTDFVYIRSILGMFIHFFCSGIFGYHYGLSYFGIQLMSKDDAKEKAGYILNWIHIASKKSLSTVFSYYHVFLAFILSILLHGTYDVLANVDLSISFKGQPISLIIVAIPIYFIFGLAFLFNVLKSKEWNMEVHRKSGKIINDEPGSSA